MGGRGESAELGNKGRWQLPFYTLLSPLRRVPLVTSPLIVVQHLWTEASGLGCVTPTPSTNAAQHILPAAFVAGTVDTRLPRSLEGALCDLDGDFKSQ